MPDTITIRPIRADDKPAWRTLWTAYLDFYETTLEDAVFDSSFARMLSGNSGEFQGLVAEQDGVLVGMAHFLFHRSMWSIENTCYLMDLYVDPSLRGGGVGRKLIEAVHTIAKENGCSGTYWLTQEFNYKGRMLYDQVATRTPFIKYAKKD